MTLRALTVHLLVLTAVCADRAASASASPVDSTVGPAAQAPGRRGASSPLAARVHELWLAADRAEVARQYTVELRLLRELAQLQPDALHVFSRLGLVCSTLRDHAGAVAACRRAVEIAPTDPGIAANYATALLEAGQLDQAEQWLSRWSSRIDDCAELGLRLARVCVLRDRAPDALAYLRAALKARNHLSPELVFDVACMFRELGQLKEAEDAFRRCMKMEPASLSASLSVIEVLRETGRLDEAEKMVQELARRHPNHTDVHWERALIHEARGRLVDAVIDFQQVIPPNPRAAKASLFAAACLIKLGQASSATSLLDGLLDPERSVPDAIRKLARQLKEQRPIEPAGQFAPRSPADHERAIRTVLDRTWTAQPCLDWLTDESTEASDAEQAATLAYALTGQGQKGAGGPRFRIEIWFRKKPWRAGPRPQQISPVPQDRTAAPWLRQIRSDLARLFPSTEFELGHQTLHSTMVFRTFAAIGRPDPRLWVRIEGSPDLEPDPTVATSWAALLCRKAATTSPGAMLQEMSTLLTGKTLLHGRATLWATISGVAGRSVSLRVEATPTLTERHEEAVYMHRHLAPSPRPLGGCRRQQPLWIEGVPAVHAREEGGLLPPREDVEAFVGRYGISISAFHAAEIGAIRQTVRSALHRIFPTLFPSVR